MSAELHALPDGWADDEVDPSLVEPNPFPPHGAPSTNGNSPAEPRTHRVIDGASWVADEPDNIPAVWGDGDTVLWAEGEPLMIVGPDGVPFAKGLVRYAATTLRRVAGRRTGDLDEGLSHEAVHRDDLVILPT